MKRHSLILQLALSAALLVWVGCDKAKLDTDVQKGSYAVGQQIGNNLKQQQVTFDSDAVSAGIRDAMQGKTSRLTQPEIQAAMAKLQEIASKKTSEAADKNKKDAADFLAKNKDKEGWTVTASGLQYKVVKEGTGKSPSDQDMVSVQYTGTLTNGEKFDSSIDRGQPAEFPVNGVIPGWSEALKLMKEGGKTQLAIPPELGYGPQGNQRIPPNSVLLFDVELLSVKPAPQAAALGGKDKQIKVQHKKPLK